jgi:ABC-type transport system involved in multi-copper enzyme maturation permease subunit
MFLLDLLAGEKQMGIDRIKYRPWNGEKSGHFRRVYTIINNVFLQKIKSKGILTIIIIGLILVHAFPIIFGALIPHEELTAEMMAGGNILIGSYLKNVLSIIFIILLVSLVCSDLVSQDLRDKSFVLYFSRPIKTFDYLLGKIGGAIGIISIFTLFPVIIYCLVVIGTQTSNDYSGSLNVLGKTIIVGILTTFFFVPYGIMISTFTKKKTYAGIGIFMSFFVLTIIGNIFTTFDQNWSFVSPINLLFYSYDIIYGIELPQNLNSNIIGVLLFCILFIPLIVTFTQVYKKEVGR